MGNLKGLLQRRRPRGSEAVKQDSIQFHCVDVINFKFRTSILLHMYGSSLCSQGSFRTVSSFSAVCPNGEILFCAISSISSFRIMSWHDDSH